MDHAQYIADYIRIYIQWYNNIILRKIENKTQLA